MTSYQARILPIVFLLATATAALAFTASGLFGRAEVLRTDHQELQIRIDQCPDGHCADAKAVVDDLLDASARLSQLEADRGALGPCDCAQLDALIGQVRLVNIIQRLHIEAWGQ